MAIGRATHPGQLPYVVVGRGAMPENKWWHGEYSSHKKAASAIGVACDLRDRYAKFTDPENQWFAWSVVDVRTGATIFEIY